MKYIHIIALSFLFLGLMSCEKQDKTFDATGVFEATEYLISAKTAGQITSLNLEEGMPLKANQKIGKIDCEQLYLQRAQLEASKKALRAKQVNANPQVEVLKQQLKAQEQHLETQKEQRKVLLSEKGRIEKLVAAEAAPSKQLDDLNNQLAVLDKQIEAFSAQFNVLKEQMQAALANAGTQNRAILSEEKPMDARLRSVEAQIDNCEIENPVAGLVLNQYVEAHEMAIPGKALYKIADLQKMYLRAYVSGSQLPKIKTGQKVKVLVDADADSYQEFEGSISWISSKAEFTPKTIQTKEERANLVYAIKVRVPNPKQAIKIGMYGEIQF